MQANFVYGREDGSTMHRTMKDIAGSRMVQAEVTQNFQVDSSLIKKRKEIQSTSKPDERFGELTDSVLLDIYPGEPLFASTVVERAMSGKNYMFHTSKTPPVFSAFNSLPLDSAMTQQEFERRFKFMGLANGVHKFGSKSGISGRVRGSGSTWNNGNSTFFAGDLITWRLQPIEPEKRREDIKQLPSIKGAPKQKMMAVMERFDPREITNILKDGLEWVLLDENKSAANLVNLEPTSKAHLTYEQEVGLNYKASDLTKLFTGVMTLAQYGLITVNIPNETNPLSPANYRSFDHVLGQKLATVNKYNVVVNRGQGITDLHLDKTHASDNRQRTHEAQFLAYKLGVLPFDPFRNHIVPAEGLVNAVLARMNTGLLKNNDNKKYFSLDKMLEGVSKKRMRDGGGVKYDMSSTTGQLVRAQMDAGPRAAQVWKQAADQVNSKVIGTALNFSKRGELLDYVM